MPLAEGFSSIMLSEFNSTDTLTATGDTVEHLMGSTQFGGAFPVRWSVLPGTQVRLGFACRFVVTGSSWTMRIRIGGTPSIRDTPAGTIVHTFTVPVGDTIVDELTALVSFPLTASYIQITGQSNGLGASINGNGTTHFIVPEVETQALAFGTQISMLHATTQEIVRGQWLVDFDKFDASNISLGWAARTFAAVGETCNARIRIGGTYLANDGTVVMSISDNFGAFDGHVASTTTSIAKPSGAQLVKASVQSTGGFAAELRGMSLIIRGV